MKITYTIDEKGQIKLPDGKPFDGEPVLIKLSRGWVEAYWDSEYQTDAYGEVMWGWEWVCLDGEFSAQLDDAKEWALLPGTWPNLATPPRRLGKSHFEREYLSMPEPMENPDPTVARAGEAIAAAFEKMALRGLAGEGIKVIKDELAEAWARKPAKHEMPFWAEDWRKRHK
jgi:hypothetical protein